MALPSLAHVLVLLAFLCTATTVFSSKVVCFEEERQALLTFKDGLSSPNSSLVLSSWVGDDCCNWIGVGCNNNTGHVVRLDLHNASIHVPHSGELNPSLLELNHLEYLDLSTNSFGYRSIPNFFGSFKTLTYLNLSHACFNGAVPSQLGNLSRLQSLDLSSFLYANCVNHLNVDNLDWLSYLSSLKYLDMGGVNLSRANDWFQVTSLLPSLSTLSFQNCSLKNLPTVTHPNVTTLTYLDLSRNHIASKFPSWLVNLTDLEFLDLSINHFKGSLPDSFVNLSNLEYLDLGFNNFSGTVSESVGQLKELETLDLSKNYLKGNIFEAHFANLTRLKVLSLSHNLLVFNVSQNWIPPPKLKYIALGSCRLGPKFPRWLRFLKDYSYIDLSNTRISDAMPTWFWNLSSKATNIYLYSNKISGKIPTSLEFYIGRTVVLNSNRFEGILPYHVSNTHIMSGVDDCRTVLYASNNFLSGSIPSSFCDIQSLYGLDLSNNQISGQIPSCFGNFSNLRYLLLSNNILEGEIPSFFDNISPLRYLTLENNNLTGQIPSWVAKLTDLWILILSNNSLVGTIPRRFESLSLILLSLSNNQLHGVLPLSFVNSTNLVSIDLSKNRLSGSLATWMWESLTQLRFLNLRSNLFYGNIPLQLSLLTSLQVLDLADNHLSGAIPSSFSNFTAMARIHNLSAGIAHLELSVIMKGIELEFTRTIGLLNTIDLSRNSLSGEIPIGLVRLIGLKGLNFSGNHLEGSIPKDIGNLQQLESLDFSRNHLSGTIPLSIAALNFLSSLNLSYNNLYGHIPSGRQLQTLPDPSIYTGNINLCGPPLSECPNELSPTPLTSNAEDEKDRSELLWFFIGEMMGFVIGFWVICGILLWSKSWRIAYYGFFDKLIDEVNLLLGNIILKVRKK